jgi:thymidylate kinase
MTRVTQGYRELANRYPERIVVVDGAMEVEKVAESVRKRIGSHLRDGP